MKALLSILFLTLSSMAFAQTGELQLNNYDKIFASPAFAMALSEANTKVNGKKSRIFYSRDNSSRTTAETLRVLVVGRIDDANGTSFQKAEFTATSLSSGMYPVSTSDVAVTPISQNHFVNFYN
jgi:hypothetical protein